VAVPPPALAIPTEAEDAREAAGAAPTARAPREVLTAVTEKLRAALRMPPPGPPLGLTEYDVEAELVVWREGRDGREGA
ncbi:DUF1992 domain-containing protein, partial [Streptomyces goshikiensis]